MSCWSSISPGDYLIILIILIWFFQKRLPRMQTWMKMASGDEGLRVKRVKADEETGSFGWMNYCSREEKIKRSGCSHKGRRRPWKSLRGWWSSRGLVRWAGGLFLHADCMVFIGSWHLSRTWNTSDKLVPRSCWIVLSNILYFASMGYSLFSPNLDERTQ